MERVDRVRWQGTERPRGARGAVCALLALSLLGGAGAGRAVHAQDRVAVGTAAGPAMTVTAGDLLDNPARYVGRTVTVSGEVNDVLGPRAFTIGGEEFLPPGELLIVSKNNFPQIPDRPATEYLVDDDIVMVTGEVRMFIGKQLSRDLGITDLGADTFADWENKPVIVVTSMLTTPRNRRAPTAVAGDPIRDVAVIITAVDPVTLAGRRVELTNTRVMSVVSDRAFLVGASPTQRLLVILDEERTPATPTEGRVNVNAGQTVTLTGTLQRMPTEAQARQQWGLDAAAAKSLANERLYLRAEKVTIAGL